MKKFVPRFVLFSLGVVFRDILQKCENNVTEIPVRKIALAYKIACRKRTRTKRIRPDLITFPDHCSVASSDLRLHGRKIPVIYHD